MRKWRFRILIGILLVPSVLVLFLLCERVRGHVSLGRYKRQLIAKGEKLTPGDMARVSSAGENGAPEIIAATGQLKEGNVLPKAYAPRMRLTSAGRAIHPTILGLGERALGAGGWWSAGIHQRHGH